MASVAFAFFSLLVIFAAWRVVTSSDIVRAALALVVVLAGIAPLFLLVGAEFIAVVQILVYVGAVVVLFLFGVMVTRAGREEGTDHDYFRRWPAALAAAVLLGGLGTAIATAEGPRSEPQVQTTAEVGVTLLRDHVIAFEAVSLVLLAALIGALALARRPQ